MKAELLEKRIDKNENKILEEKELIEFISDDNNLKDLAQHLSLNRNNWGDTISSAIKEKTFLNYRLQDVIGNKIRNNEHLNTEELSLLKLQYLIDTKNAINTPFTEVNFLSYLRSHYGNFSYLMDQEERENKKLREKKGGFDSYKIDYLPNIMGVDEGIVAPLLSLNEDDKKTNLQEIIKWAEDNFWLEMMREKRSADKRNVNKQTTFIESGTAAVLMPQVYGINKGYKMVADFFAKEKEADKKAKLHNEYIDYDLAVFAFTKYLQFINNKHESILNHAGYADNKEFTKQIKLKQKFETGLDHWTQEKFPTIHSIIEKFSEYQEESEKNIKEYYKDTLSLNKAENKFTRFQEHAGTLIHEYNIEGLMEGMNKEPTSGEEAQSLAENMQKLFEYQNSIDNLRQELGEEELHKYEEYMKKQINITQKYGIDNLEKWSKELNEYSSKLEIYKKEHATFDFDKYQKYTELILDSDLADSFQIIDSIDSLLKNPLDEDFPYLGIKNKAEKEKQKQNRTDFYWNLLKKRIPYLYRQLNIIAGGWNGLVNSTIGTGSQLGLLITRLWKDKDQRHAAADSQRTFEEFFKIGLSSNQKAPILTEDGKLNFTLDNTTNTVAEMAVNMVCLIYGGGFAAKGISGIGAVAVRSGFKGIGKLGVLTGTKVSGRAGLFSYSFLQNIGPSFSEAIQSGMDGKQAFSYAMFSSILQSGLELISPNRFLFGEGKNVAKMCIRNILSTKDPRIWKELGRNLLKTVSKEILEENIQESLQLVAGNLVNLWANDERGTNLDADFNLNNFVATAILTTLTTGVVTGVSSGVEFGNNLKNVNKDALKMQIIQNEGLYNDVIQTLNDATSGKIDIGIDLTQLTALQEELVGLKNITDLIQTSNKDSQKLEGKEYFKDKESKLGFTKDIAIKNSAFMDQMVGELNSNQNQQEVFQRIRERVNTLHMETNGTSLELSDVQIQSLITAHAQEGNLGDLNFKELRNKTELLSETINDPKIRRFLLEAGFSGQEVSLKVEGNYARNKEILNKLGIKTGESEGAVMFITELNPDGLQNIFRNRDLLFNRFGIEMTKDNIRNFSSLPKDTFLFIREHQQLIIDLGIWRYPEAITALSKLNNKERLSLKRNKPFLDKLGIRTFPVYMKVLSQLNDIQLKVLIENENFIKNDWGIDISVSNIERLVHITAEEFQKMKKEFLETGKITEDYLERNYAKNKEIFNKLEVYFRNNTFDHIIPRLNPNGLQNVFDNRILLKRLKIRIDPLTIQHLSNLSEDNFIFIKNNEKLISNLGILINNLTIDALSELNNEQHRSLEVNKPLLNKLGIKIDPDNMEGLSQFKNSQFMFLQLYKNLIENELGIKINTLSINSFSNINKEQLQLIIQNKQLIETGLGIDISSYNIKALTQITPEEFKLIKREILETGNIKVDNVNFFLEVLKTIPSLSDYKTYLIKKEFFLKNHQSLSNEEFNKLFGKGFNNSDGFPTQKGGNGKTNQLGKYGKGEIRQTSLGYCYAYTAFEILKKSNFFDVLIKTSITPFEGGWEVRVPLGDPNGEKIIVNKNEIDSRFTIDERRGEISINSESSLGFKILEIAFIKKSILDHCKSPENSMHGHNNFVKKIDIENIQKEHQNTGDFTITSQWLKQLEGGIIGKTMASLLGENNIITTFSTIDNIELLLNLEKTGTIKIGLSNNMKIDNRSNKLAKDFGNFLSLENGVKIYKKHAYSLEKSYIDPKSGKTILVIINPWNTGEKILLTIPEVKELFSRLNISGININNIFSNPSKNSPIPPSHTGSLD